MVDTAVEEIKHLDFTPVLPCEMTEHQVAHDGLPAAWKCLVRCPCGRSGIGLTCEAGRARLRSGQAIFTRRTCGRSTVTGVIAEFEPIGSR